MTRQSYTGLYIDTETGGLEKSIHALTSVSIGRFTLFADPDRETQLETIQVHIIPAGGLIVTDTALAIQGLTRADLEWSPTSNRMDEKAATEYLHEWLLPRWAAREKRWPYHALPIYGHNCEFDRGFLTALVERCNLKNKVNLVNIISGRDARWNCTRYIAEYLVQKDVLELPLKPDGGGSVSLDPLMERLGIPGRQGEGHDAGEDVRLGVAVLGKLLRLDGWWE